MLESENLFYDVLIIGSGIAGVAAAIEARTEGLSVLLLSKGTTGRQCSSFYAGGSLRPLFEEVKGVIGYETGIGKYLFDPELVAIYSREAKKEVEGLISLGIALKKRGDEYMPELRETGGPGGSYIMIPMVKKAQELGVIFLANKRAIDFLLSDGQVKGALALDEKGRLLKIGAKATILATGGGAGVFEHNSNPEGIMGDGYVMALRAGAGLINMEYVHFYPVGMVDSFFPHRRAGPTLLAHEGALLVNGKGEDIVEKHLKITLQRAITIPSVRFEMLSKIVALEEKKNGAYLDLRGIASEEWDKILSSPWPKAHYDKAPVDLRKQKCPVIPLAHTFLGGVKINVKGEASAPGFFAGGEVVGGTYSGEEGANQLSRCLTMGAIAGRNVVPFVRSMKSMKVKDQEWQGIISRITKITEGKGTEDPIELKNKISQTVYASLGPIREGDTMEKGLKGIEVLDKKISSMKVEKLPGLHDALEAENMILLARALLGAALRRKESRGPHFRSDFPNKDDSWFKRIAISMDKKDGQLKFSGEKIQANP